MARRTKTETFEVDKPDDLTVGALSDWLGSLPPQAHKGVVSPVTEWRGYGQGEHEEFAGLSVTYTVDVS